MIKAFEDNNEKNKRYDRLSQSKTESNNIVQEVTLIYFPFTTSVICDSIKS